MQINGLYIFQSKMGSNNISNNNMHKNRQISAFGLKMSEAIKSDIVSFTSNVKYSSAEKLTNYAVKILEENGLKENQKVHITGNSKYLPLMNALSAEAYKKGSGLVSYRVIEPEMEALKKKYNIFETFDFEKKEINDLKESKALFINLDDDVNHYQKAKLSKSEIKTELDKVRTVVPKSVQKLFLISPKEILKDALDMHEGQPLAIRCEREHLPMVEKLVDWAYSKNDTRLVNVAIADYNRVNMLKYAKESVLEEVPNVSKDMEQEFYDKDVAYLVLDGADPKRLDGIPSHRIVKNNKARNTALAEIYDKTTSNVPWLVYYAPTTKSCASVYTEYKNPIDALKHAYKDANKINRIGHLSEHVEQLNYRAKKMNELIDNGYRTLHYVSVDAKTKLPDGKTDFQITMSPKSVFNAARMKMDKYGHEPLVNIPTEEVFTAPQADTAQGVISATMPLTLNGKIVDGIRFRFDKGKIVEVKADTNEEMLKSHIKSFENADRLGEVAIVAGSPIAKTGRLFNSTLLDENAACHLAIGNAYPDTVKGAVEIEDYNKMKQYLKDLNINSSATHNDFMVGGVGVNISAINDETGDIIEVIKNDKFLL